MRLLLCLSAAVFLSAAPIRAQLTPPAARAPDCVDPEGIFRALEAYFKSLSGPAGERDWTALREVVLPTARFDAIGINVSGDNQYYPQSLEDFLAHLGKYVQGSGFFQLAVDPQIRCMRRVAQIWTRFESRNEHKAAVIDQGVDGRATRL